MPNDEYWRGRFENLQNAELNKGAKYYSELDKQFKDAQMANQTKIESWYARLAKNNDISLQEAHQLLDKNELEEFHWTVDQYVKHGEENAITHEFEKELENASAKTHITRLESIQYDMQMQTEKLYGNMTDGLDSTLRDIYEDGYYRTAFEVQKGLGVGTSFARVDSNRLDTAVNEAWTADGRNFSDRIWTNKTKLTNELNTTLTQSIIRGDDPQKAINDIARKMEVSKNAAGTLVMTESAYQASACQHDCFNELGVEKYKFTATLDDRTSDICQDMDGQIFDMKDYEVGVTAPPLHCNCRSATIPYFDDNYGQPGECIARGEDGKEYNVPADMKYKDWKKQYVDSPVKADETTKITDKGVNNEYTADRKLMNSKEYHDEFDDITEHKAVNESLYQESMNIVNHRDGTDYEDICAIGAQTGDVIVKNDLSVRHGATGFTKEQFETFSSYEGNKILLHNHPNGSRPSYTDIKTLFDNDDVESSVAVGHDGSVHVISNPDRTVDIEKAWNKVYNLYIDKYKDKAIAEHKALDYIYEQGIFKYTKR